MQKNKMLKDKSIVFKWLVSYTIILLTPILVTSVSYLTTYHVVQKQITQSNSILLTRMQKEMDGILNDVNKLCIQIAYDPQVRGVLGFEGKINDPQYYDILKASQSLTSFKYFYPSIDEFFVSFKYSDMVLSNSRSMDKKSFYENTFGDSKMTKEQWQNILNNNYNGSYFLMPNGIGKSQYIAYARSIPLTNIDQTTANLFVLIRESRFSEVANSLKMANGGYTFILDSNSNIIFSTDGTVLSDNELYKKLTGDVGILHTKINGQKVTVSYIGSKANSWKYVTVIPSQVFWNELVYTRTVMIISILLCVILGGLLTAFLLKKNYSPVSRLMKIIDKNMETLFSPAGNEFSYIENAVVKTLNEKVKINQRLSLQNKALRSNFLIKLLKGDFKAEKSLDEYLVSYDLNFKTDSFAVILFYIEDVDEELLEEKYDFNLIQFIMTNVIEEVVSRSHQGIMLEIDEMMACLVNFNKPGEDGEINELLSAIKESQEFIYKNYKISFTTSFSNIHRTVYRISDAYREAQQAMEYKIVMGIKGISFYSEFSHLLRGEYYFPLEKEQGLINSLKAADCENAKVIMEEVFRVNFMENAPTALQKKWFEFTFMGTMMRTINDIKEIHDFDFTNIIKDVEKLIYHESSTDFMKHGYRIIESFCEKVRSKNCSHQTRDEVISYIHKHYSDIDLSISTIARDLGMHPVYVSQMFKEKVGEGMLEYIHKIRIKEAKILLKENKNIILDDVAAKVGFANTRTFARVFKRYEGIAPGKYKEISFAKPDTGIDMDNEL